MTPYGLRPIHFLGVDQMLHKTGGIVATHVTPYGVALTINVSKSDFDDVSKSKVYMDSETSINPS